MFNCVIFMKKIKNLYVRTQKSEKINKDIEGMKNFLKEFTIIEKRDKEEIEIWNEYLIYAIAFNTNIVNKYKNIIC